MRISDWSSDVCSADLIKTGHIAAATSQCRQRLAVEPQNAAIWGLLASALAVGGDINEAGKSLARAIASDPTEPAYHVQMGALYARLDRAADPAACFERALALAPQHLPALHGRATALWAPGDLLPGRHASPTIVARTGDA